MPTLLELGYLRELVRQYNHRGYEAKATLLKFGQRGLRLREQYQWLAPGSKGPA